jgi:hypothetical protein
LLDAAAALLKHSKLCRFGRLLPVFKIAGLVPDGGKPTAFSFLLSHYQFASGTEGTRSSEAMQGFTT